jgi:hypothetical protein
MAWSSQYPLQGIGIGSNSPFDVDKLLRSERTREEQFGKRVSMIIEKGDDNLAHLVWIAGR